MKMFGYIITRLFNTVNCVLLQCIQIVASLSGTQTAAWTSTGFLPPKKYRKVKKKDEIKKNLIVHLRNLEIYHLGKHASIRFII